MILRYSRYCTSPTHPTKQNTMSAVCLRIIVTNRSMYLFTYIHTRTHTHTHTRTHAHTHTNKHTTGRNRNRATAATATAKTPQCIRSVHPVYPHRTEQDGLTVPSPINHTVNESLSFRVCVCVCVCVYVHPFIQQSLSLSTSILGGKQSYMYGLLS